MTPLRRHVATGILLLLCIRTCCFDGDISYVWQVLRHNIHAPASQGINESANFRFLQRLSVIFGFRRDCPRSPASCRDYRPRKMASCRDCPCDSASCRDSRQEAESHGQSLQEAIYQVQQSRQEATDLGQSLRKPNMMDSLCGSQI